MKNSYHFSLIIIMFVLLMLIKIIKDSCNIGIHVNVNIRGWEEKGLRGQKLEIETLRLSERKRIYPEFLKINVIQFSTPSAERKMTDTVTMRGKMDCRKWSTLYHARVERK